MGNSTGNGTPLSPEALVYIEKVRRATRRLGAADRPAEQLRSSLGALAEVARFDVEVPTASARREVEVLKTGIKRLQGWYMRYLSEQMASFADGVMRLASDLVVRAEELGSTTDELANRLAAAEERLRRLEGMGMGMVPAPAPQAQVQAQAQAPALGGSHPGQATTATAPPVAASNALPGHGGAPVAGPQPRGQVTTPREESRR